MVSYVAYVNEPGQPSSESFLFEQTVGPLGFITDMY